MRLQPEILAVSLAALAGGAVAHLLKLKRKYRSDAPVMQALGGYEADIEH